MHAPTSRSISIRRRALFGSLVFLLLLLAGLSNAHSAEIVPSVGITRTPDSDENKMSYGLELRQSLAPMVKLGFGASYRNEEYFNGDLNVRTVPVTASVWLAPTPILYVGGGAGAYITTTDYKETFLIPSESKTEFGAHVGGGMSFPLAPLVSLDFQGRYVFLGQRTNAITSGDFDPSFWNASAGIAFKF